MSLVRAVVSVALVVFCGGFIPVGGCARGCGRAGRVASHEADDIARLGVRGGVHAGEDLAVSGSRYGRYSVAASEELGVAGSRLHGASVADDLEGAGLRLSEQQHGEVMDALDVAKDITEEVIGQLANSDDSDDDEAEATIAQAAVDLELELQKTLTPQQLREFHARMGSSVDLTYRLAREQAAKRAAGSGQK